MADLSAPLLMFIAYRHAEGQIMDGMVAGGFGDVTHAQARVFARIGPRGSRLTELAEQAQITKQSAGFLVDQLEKAGYVTRVADPTDARARLVVLAERGRRAQRYAKRIERQIVREWTKHLGAERMDVLEETMALLREITDPYR